MTVYELSVQWTLGGTVLGKTFFHLGGAAPTISPLPTFFDAIKGGFPGVFSWDISPYWKILQESDGKMVGIGGTGPAPRITPTGPNAYVPQAGVQVKWDTNGFVNGRRVSGMTYLVPVCSSQFGADGKVLAALCNTINAAADVMRIAYGTGLVIWSRPLFEKDANGHPTDVLKRPGSIHPVTSVTTPVKPVTLNGRRDP